MMVFLFLALLAGAGLSEATKNNCESGKYCKKADGDCSTDISMCTPCTNPAPAANDPSRKHFDEHCEKITIGKPDSQKEADKSNDDILGVPLIVVIPVTVIAGVILIIIVICVI